MQWFRVKHWVKTSMWVIPVLFILGGIVLSSTFIAIDPTGELVPQGISGDATAAMQILYLISFAMLTLTGLVLSMVVLVVQLAMSTFSPRIVRQILQDRPSQCAIGLFAGTFTFSLLTMRTVVTAPEGGTAPGLAVAVSILLVLSCIVTLVWYLNHIGQSLRVAPWLAGSPRIPSPLSTEFFRRAGKNSSAMTSSYSRSAVEFFSNSIRPDSSSSLRAQTVPSNSCGP
ncbi:DUF2254 family protein [Arthrobacter sp. Hz1]